MKKRSNIILLLLLALVTTPAVVVLLYELNSYDANEHYLQESYKKQLSTVVFSVNQFLLESANTWGRELGTYWEAHNTATTPRFCQLYHAIREVFVTDTSFSDLQYLYIAPGYDFRVNGVSAELRTHVKQLPSLQRAGYPKIEAGTVPGNDSLLLFACAITPEDEPAHIAFIVISRDEYISRIVKPQVQSVAGNFFHVMIYSNPTSDSLAAAHVFYSTSPDISFEPENSEKLWLIPDCNIGIKLRTGDISEFVAKRTQTSLLLFGSLLFFVSVGAIYMIRSVRKELQVAQMKSDFVANISHEFRTPLSLISMFAETLELGRVKNDAKKMEYYGVIHSEAQRLSKLVNAILNFSHIESGQRSYQMKEFVLQDLLEDITKSYRYHAQQRGFLFRLSMPSEKILLNADYEALTEAIINLIDNGMKYSQEKKEISLNCGIEDTMVFIEVGDKGIGFRAEEKDRIFDKFYRVPTGNVHNVKGSGIGLSIVKHVIDAHEGRIEVESAPGEGSTFRLLLPKPL